MCDMRPGIHQTRSLAATREPVQAQTIRVHSMWQFVRAEAGTRPAQKNRAVWFPTTTGASAETTQDR